MADVITRLKLESGEYDSKIQRAVSGLKRMEEEYRNVDGTLAVLKKDQLEYVQSLGRMQTVSNTVRGKINELSQAYVELRSQYNRLTDEEKQGDFGKALSASLDQLKQRLEDGKAELANISSELKNTEKASQDTGGIVDQLAQKFTINVDALKLFEIGMKAANVALDVAKDAFFANEQQLDAWGATVESAESLYKGFLNSLNNGDISGYLNSINEIVRAANSAYNALDALGTFNAFNQVNVEKARTNMTESIVDYREGKADKNAVRAAGDAYKKELEERRRLEQRAYIEAIGKVAAERGVNKQDLIDALSGSYGNYQDLKNIQPTGKVTKYSPGIMPGSQGSYTTYTVAQGRQEKLGEALRQLNDTELQSLQALGAQAQRTSNEIAQVDRQLVRVLNSRQGGSGGGGITTPRTTTTKVNGGTEPYTGPIVLDIPEGTTESMKELSEQLRYFNELRQSATTTDDYNTALEGIEHTKQQMGVQGDALAMGVSTDAMIAMQESLKESMAESFASAFEGFQTNEKDVEGMKEGNPMEEMKKGMEMLSTVMSGLSSVTSGLSAVGIKLDGEFGQFLKGIQGVISIVQGVMTIITASSVPSEAANTISTNANTIALGVLTDAVTANSIIHAIPGLANGGVIGRAAFGFTIPGNSLSGDNLRLPVVGGGMIAVNSGETILNRAQAGNLLAQLESSDRDQEGGAQPYVDGELIFLGINNYLRRSGMGELVTSN